ncbi:MAG: leucyl aminopeptidase family protein [Pseudomonadota bacterium]
MSKFFVKSAENAIPVTPVTTETLQSWLETQDAFVKSYVTSQGFEAEPESFALIPDTKGHTDRVLLGVDPNDKLYRYAELAKKLPQGTYYIDDETLDAQDATQAIIGWALGQYEFDRYLEDKAEAPKKLVLPAKADVKTAESAVTSTALVRDLVNTPANDLGPEELVNAGEELAREFGGVTSIITGDDLLKQNYPMIHAVGRAADRAPRLFDMTWGDEKSPKVTLVGKGVIFDTGGLNLKPGSSMGLMKKDMGGAAHVLGLARMIMENDLPIRLRVLVPAVENAISGNAFRPGDILQSRKGISVEIENTDAEGRLVLADALAEACSEKPDLLIDFATLTGAARVALGPDVPPVFTDNDALADLFTKTGKDIQDPLWRLPLWDEYYSMMKSTVADICHTGAGGQAGSITAALFLKKFVDEDINWAHIDTWAWRKSSRPGRPVGGDAIGMRAVYQVIKDKYAAK